MNGWANYETWNVTLWIANDERLYRLASDCRSYAEFRRVLSGIDALAKSEHVAIPLARKTPDGVSWNDPQLDLAAIREWWNDTFPLPLRKLAKSKGQTMELDIFTLSYLETALWASTDDEGEPLDVRYGVADIAPEAMKTIVDDCKAFQEDNRSLLTTRHFAERGCPLSQAGQDFWLTRNGHGSGFWDGAWKDDAGKILTRSAKVYGSQDVYIGDDGKLYVS